MKRFEKIRILCMFIFGAFLFIKCSAHVLAGDRLQHLRQSKNKELEKYIVETARISVEKYVQEQRRWEPAGHFFDVLNEPAGVFVTIMKKGKVRACMGTIEPKEENMAREVSRSAVLACAHDYWFPPILESELEDLKYIISVVGPLRRVTSEAQLNPQKFGLLVRRGNRSALLLPGEAKTTEWQIFQCKKKAGIPQNASVEMFIFETITFGP